MEQEVCPDCGEVHDDEPVDLSPEEFCDRMEALEGIVDDVDECGQILLVSTLAAHVLSFVDPHDRKKARRALIKWMDEETRTMVIGMCDA